MVMNKMKFTEEELRDFLKLVMENNELVFNMNQRGIYGGKYKVYDFTYNGIVITDPYMDETGRFEVDPIEHYGRYNILRMVETFLEDVMKDQKHYH